MNRMCPILLERWNIALTKTHRNQNMIAHHHQHQKLQSAHLETRQQHAGPFCIPKLQEYSAGYRIQNAWQEAMVLLLVEE